MGYDAVAISASDVQAGGSFLDETLLDGFPWISANLLGENGQPVAPSYVLKTVNSLRIAIIGLTDTLSEEAGYSTLDYQASIPRVLKDIATRCDMVILLSNLADTVNRQIASQYPEINLILSSDSRLGKMSPVVINQTLITQTSARGKYLGKLDIEWNGGGHWYNDRLVPLAELRKRKKAITTQLEQLSPIKNKKKISRLQLQHKRLDKEINNRMALEGNQAGQANRHRLRFIPVQPTNSPKNIEAIVRDIDNMI